MPPTQPHTAGFDPRPSREAAIWRCAGALALGGREEQQDALSILPSPPESPRLLALADGMGGHRGGAMASLAVMEAAEGGLQSSASADGAADPRALLQGICLDAHHRLLALAEATGMTPRSTVVLLWLDGGDAHWVHVGDSRLYHFRDSRVLYRSLDHSVVQMMVDRGRLRPEEVPGHPDRNRIWASLGGTSTPQPEYHWSATEIGDVFLLCSDGLWEHIPEETMVEALATADLQRAADHLTEEAVRRAGPEGDNVSVLLARREAGPPDPGTGRARTLNKSWLSRIVGRMQPLGERA